MARALAPAARIQRDTAAQRRLLPAVRASVNALLAHRRIHEAHADGLLRPRMASLRASLAASPFMREALRAEGLAPADLDRPADLVHFPLLTRDAMADAWRALPAFLDGAGRGDAVVRSSGSTGQPVLVVKDAYDQVHMWAVLRFFTRILGIRLPRRPRVVLLDALPSGMAYSVRLPLLHQGALHRISLAAPRPGERLSRVRPSVVFSDPAGLHWLAAHPPRTMPLLLLSSAEHLSGAERRLIAATVPCPLVNYYATTETGPIAWECLAAPGRFHILVPDVWVEEVGGEVVVTRLRPSVLPLLRYRTGDRGAVRWRDCPCGVLGPCLEELGGRGACRFVLPGGGDVDAWQLAWVFKHHPLTSFRLTQIRPDAFLLELGGAAAAGATASLLTQALQQLGWRDPVVTVVPWTGSAVVGKAIPFLRRDDGPLYSAADPTTRRSPA